jgi:hypothetical protein
MKHGMEFGQVGKFARASHSSKWHGVWAGRDRRSGIAIRPNGMEQAKSYTR